MHFGCNCKACKFSRDGSWLALCFSLCIKANILQIDSKKTEKSDYEVKLVIYWVKKLINALENYKNYTINGMASEENLKIYHTAIKFLEDVYEYKF
jgi:hypothetical protein